MTANWQEQYESKRATLEEAIQLIPKGKHIFIGSGATEPVGLVEELVAQEARFADNVIVHLLTLGPAPYVDAKYQDRFRHAAFFIGANVREAVRDGRADYVPVFLSQIPDLIRSRRLPVDVALIQVAPPDPFGFVNLGVSVDVVLAAIQSASLVIAEINPNMPVTYGSGFVPMDRIDKWIYRPVPIPTVERKPPDDVATEIGRNVASLVEDRATIQLGIGQIPDAVTAALRDKKDLGIWTEMVPDGAVDLVKNGNITGRYKTIEPRKVSASFTFGTQETYDFVNKNPLFVFHPSDFINNPATVARQHKMTAINGALQIDLTGQVCADSIGTKFYSGIGGQVDFVRGASMCPGGKSITAIRSTANQGKISRIVATLEEGAGVVTSRGDVQYVVTEYGIADLRGKSIRDRAMALISIAHPDYRPELLNASKNRHYVFADQIAPRASAPQTYEKRVAIEPDSEVLLRSIRITDEQKMSDLFYSLSESTVYKRWMVAMPRMPHKKILPYLKAEDPRNVAIVIETHPTNSESELIGVGRYHVSPGSGSAEVALVIRDDHQGKGLGTALLQHLIDIAKENGIPGFTAEVLPSNSAMMHVFHKADLKIQSSLSEGSYHLEMPLQQNGQT
ncbi:MAG: GNAT family N-acetyltransferase [Candidatus Eisenbacteria bacterium]|uniref:GNAT family N-acetyltransferase n=1 Tax=Eiseniibacteriota bacterium TaxID=2212470 RepID=A0A7Y2H2N6_UNCEI|nr:GNAT family N-acetyltransferase [Candidatus Eisenbacteria bacterium]